MPDDLWAETYARQFKLLCQHLLVLVRDTRRQGGLAFGFWGMTLFLVHLKI